MAPARGAGSIANVGGDPPPAASYEKLVAEADRLLENAASARAQVLYAQALKLRPAGSEALAGLGYVALDRGRMVQALTLFRRALAGEGAHGSALFGMAEAHRAAGDDVQALEHYRRYLEEEPDGLEATAARRHVKMIEARNAARGVPAPLVDPMAPATQP